MASLTIPRLNRAGHRLTGVPGLLFAFIILLAGCSSPGRGISDLQVGEKAEAFVGLSLPVSARVSAEAAIVEISIAIRPVSDEGWTFAAQYSDGIAGKNKADFRTDVAIPATAEPGNYRLTLRLVEADGSVTEASADFRLTIDSTVPTASGLDVGINAAGNDLHLETELTAPSGIKSVFVAIEGNAWSKEFKFAGEQLVGQLTHHFHEHVHVSEAPEGDYRVILTVEDQKGRRAQTEGMFAKK